MSEHRELRAGEIDTLLKARAHAERLMRGISQETLQEMRRAVQHANEQVAPLMRTAAEDTDTVKRDIPHEPGNWMRFQPLTKMELDEAKAKVRDQTRYDLVDGLKFPPPSSLDGYDKGFLIQHSIVNWGGPHYGEPYSPELIGDLSLETYEWAARQVLDVSEGRLRPLRSGGISPTILAACLRDAYDYPSERIRRVVEIVTTSVIKPKSTSAYVSRGRGLIKKRGNGCPFHEPVPPIIQAALEAEKREYKVEMALAADM